MVNEKSPEQRGRENEILVVEYYRKQGYDVLNVNEKGFPDLIVLKDGKIEFLVEVKGGSHPVHTFQKELHERLRRMGLKVKVVRVINGKIVEKITS